MDLSSLKGIRVLLSEALEENTIVVSKNIYEQLIDPEEADRKEKERFDELTKKAEWLGLV